MELKCTLPPEIERRLRQEIGAEPIRYSVVSDLTLERQFGESYLVVTDTHLAVCDNANHARSYELAGIDEVKIDELFGSGRLLAIADGVETPLIYYTKVIVPEFAVMCRVVNALIRGKEPELPDEQELSHCPKCGAPLPERGGTCPRCVSRVTMFARLLGIIRPYRFRAISVVVLAFVAVGSQMVPPFLIGHLVDDVIKTDYYSAAMRRGLLLWLVGAMLLFGLIHLAARFLTATIGCWVAVRVVADLRNRLHWQLQRLKLSYFNHRDSGQIVARVAHDTRELQLFLTEGMPYLLVNTVLFTSIAILLLMKDWRLALFVFVPVPVLMGGATWFWRRLLTLFHKFGSLRGAMHSTLGESIHGIRSVKAYSQEERRDVKFGGVSEDLFRVGFRVNRTWIGFAEVTGWIMSVGIVGVWYFGARRLTTSNPGITLGELMTFMFLAQQFYQPLRMYTVLLNWMTHAMASLERIFGVLDAKPETYDAPDAVPLPKIDGRIAFDDVHFSYERGKEVIKGISFDVRPGEMIGLVGKSGAGKSTIINLMCRLYDVDSGVVAVDGHNVRDVRLLDLRRQIGMVMQEPFLFNASILENIRAGAPETTFEDIVRAARAAHAHDFIMDKEDGYDTVVGEGGHALSAGEKQRVAIAQAILHDPPILILDEATSSVDTETERAIQQATANLVKNRTTIAIAHRLATLRNADRLIVIDDGRIVETGSHDELLAGEGIYAKLVKAQSELAQMKSTVWTE